VLVGLVAKIRSRSQRILVRVGINFLDGAGWGTLHAVQVGVGGPTVYVGLLTMWRWAGGVAVQLRTRGTM